MYSPSIQARIDAEKQLDQQSGPQLPMPRVRHQGETGQFLVRELKDGKLEKEEVQLVTGKSWGGVILRVAYLVESKYVPQSTSKEFTREFTSFQHEPIELLERTFGEGGKTSHVETYTDYQTFKTKTMAYDRKGVAIAWPYSLKIVLYVWHFSRGEIVKFVCGGSALSEWFSYTSRNGRKGPNCISEPWNKLEGAELLYQIKTVFTSNEVTSDKGMKYHRLSFKAFEICNDQEMELVFTQKDRVTEWAQAWDKLRKKKEPEQEDGVSTDDIPTIDAEADLKPTTDEEAFAIMNAQRAKERAEIEAAMSDVPF